jgi:hypothetical protein
MSYDQREAFHVSKQLKRFYEYLEENEDSDDRKLPICREVCPTCDGTGKHVNPAIDSHGISGEEFANDPGFAEDYFNGVYDVTCYECHGRNVIDAIDYDRAVIECPDLYKKYVDWLADEIYYDSVCRAERAMGA